MSVLIYPSPRTVVVLVVYQWYIPGRWYTADPSFISHILISYHVISLFHLVVDLRFLWCVMSNDSALLFRIVT